MSEYCSPCAITRPPPVFRTRSCSLADFPSADQRERELISEWVFRNQASRVVCVGMVEPFFVFFKHTALIERPGGLGKGFVCMD